MCACYHPLKIFYTGRKTEKGGREGVITSGFLERLSLKTAARKLPGLKLTDCKWMEQDVNGNYFLTKSDQIPCGKCIGCKLSKSQDWATRVMLEAKEYGDRNAFLTLTYDDGHLPKDGKVTKREMQLFIKKLRKAYGNGLRICYCGEYGSITKRPHYHMLILNINIQNQKRWNKVLTTSQDIDKIWGKGNVLIGKVTFQSAAYVARYQVKSVGFDDGSFFVTPRRPGLGYDYYAKNGQIFGNGKIYMAGNKGNQFSIPKYFKRKLREEDEITALYLSEKMKPGMDAKARQLVKAYEGKGSLEKVLEYQEEEQKRKARKLHRPIN